MCSLARRARGEEKAVGMQVWWLMRSEGCGGLELGSWMSFGSRHTARRVKLTRAAFT